jgi:hypothetical protein
LENNKKKLIDWALDEFKSNILIKEQRWNYFPAQPYYDYRTLIKINGIGYEGRGVSSSQQQALTSSIAEAIERFSLKDHQNAYSSNGCAIHTNEELASLNSRLELIERHYVMLFTLGYCNRYLYGRLEIPTKINGLIDLLNNKSIGVIFYNLYSSDSEFVVLCQMSGLNVTPSFGVAFGASCKNKLEDSIEASFCEALPNVIAFMNGNDDAITLNEFRNIIKPSPLDHLNLYLNTEYARDYLSRRVLMPVNLTPISPDLFITEEIQYRYSHLFPVIKTSHPDCIETRWGLIPEDSMPRNLNPDFPLVLP